MKRILFLFSVVLSALTCCTNATDTTDSSVWNNPRADINTFNGSNNWDLNITKVILGETETTIYLTAERYEGNSFTFAPETFLRVGDSTYSLLGIDGITPGQFFAVDKSGKRDIIMHFNPLPQDTKSFDLIESETIPGPFNIYGIHKFDEKSLKLTKTHWRNVRTGNWTISFMGGYVIYDNKIWKCDNAFGDSISNLSFSMNCEGDTANVYVGKLKKGIRKIKVSTGGKSQSFKCDRFESEFVPDYPARGRHANKLKDYGYDKVDSVTISGLLIKSRDMDLTASVDFPDAITGDNPKYVGTVTDDGSFTVTFPIVNTTYAMMRMNVFFVSFGFPVVPGGDYFVFIDQTQGCTYIMGNDSRLPNEVHAYENSFFARYDRVEDTEFRTDLDGYLGYLKETRNEHFEKLDSLKKVRPNLSDGFIELAEIFSTLDLYRMIGQARFENQEDMYAIPQNMMDFLEDDLSRQSITPYSLSYDFGYFLRDFTEHLSNEMHIGNAKTTEVIDYAQKDGNLVELTPEEYSLIEWYDELTNHLNAIISDMKGDDKRINDSIKHYFEAKSDSITMANELLNRLPIKEMLNKYTTAVSLGKSFDNLLLSLDTLHFEKTFNDLALTHYFARKISSNRHSVPTYLLAKYDSAVTFAPAKKRVHELNDKYLAMEKIDIASLGNDVSPEELASMSDGESILRKITEPYRGKIVYIDVWGSWCHPCLENLSHASELKEKLKDYDIVYLYLASGTTDKAWKGVIKEYNIAGENCVHYNLPAREQTLVEQFLNVQGFPTYRILNRIGALLDVECNPTSVTSLKTTLEKL